MSQYSRVSQTPTAMILISSASVGGASTEILNIPTLLATDAIVAVTQKTAGANNLPLLGWSTQVAGHITGIWSADPGAGAVLLVTIVR
jgi:hypothetical protein